MSEPAEFLSEEMAIRPDLPDLSAVAREQYTLEWGVRQSDGRVHGDPALRTAGAVQADAFAHFIVEGLRCGDIGPGRWMGLDQFFGMTALARPRAAQHKSETHDRAIRFER
jgi:hypothetical protein